MSTPQKTKSKKGASLILTAAMLFLAIALAVSAVTQLQSGHIVTGCVSIVGALLFSGVTGLQIHDLIRSRKHPQEDQHD